MLCVLMVKGMSVVVYVMLSLMSVFLNCDDICMCVVNKQLEHLEFVFDSVYVDLHFFCRVSVLVLCL